MKGEAAALSVCAQRCPSHYFSTTLCSSLLLAFTMPLATSVTVHVIAQKITYYAELRDLGSEGIHCKNKCKFVILKLP